MAFEKMFLFKELGFIKARLSCQRDGTTYKRRLHGGKSSGWLDLNCRLREDSSEHLLGQALLVSLRPDSSNPTDILTSHLSLFLDLSWFLVGKSKPSVGNLALRTLEWLWPLLLGKVQLPTCVNTSPRGSLFEDPIL